MRIHISLLPDEIIQRYNLLNYADKNGWIYIQINKGMHGLKQAGYYAHQNLAKHLAKYGYSPSKHTKGL